MLDFISARFRDMFKWKLIKQHYGVMPTIGLTVLGFGLMISFVTHLVRHKPNLEFTSRPRWLDMQTERPWKLIDGRKLDRPIFTAKEKPEFVQLKKELYEIYYPRK